MAYRRARIASGLVLALALAASAHAQTVFSLDGSNLSFTFGGLSFTVSGCSLSNTSGVATGTSCGGDEMIGVSTSSGVEIEFLGNGTTNRGSDLVSFANSSTGSQNVHFTLTVASTSSRTDIAGVSAAVAGSYPSGTTIGASMLLNGVTGCSVSGGYQSGTTCNPWPFQNSSATASFSPVDSLSINYVLGATGAPGQTVVLSNATAIFNPVPEPASIALLAVGLAGLGVARRCRKRSPRNLDASRNVSPP